MSLRVPVLSLDLRGHGASGGACTLGDREAEDVTAALRWLRGTGHDHVVTIGASMGATAALHATALGAPTDAVVSVSGPAWFRDPPDTAALQRLHTIWTRPAARAGMRVAFGVRVAGPAAWRPPPHPADLAVRAVPLLVVHGADDAYFPPADADALHAAAPSGSALWQEPHGFGHAEDGFSAAFVDRLTTAVLAVAEDGRFPAG